MSIGRRASEVWQVVPQRAARTGRPAGDRADGRRPPRAAFAGG
ncbi:hypothetical protein ACRAWF_25650 [Streptomyces sp. L7]